MADEQEILDAPASNAMILAMVLQWKVDHEEIECMKNRIDELEQIVFRLENPEKNFLVASFFGDQRGDRGLPLIL